jgi:lipopolysaccharide transport system permease protein
VKKELVTVYNRNTRLKAPVSEAFRTVFHNAWSYRWLIWRFFVRDFTSPYRQSFLGTLWSFIVPMIPVSAYLVLVFMGVLDTRAGMPFLLYVVTGMTFWLFIAGSITSMMNSIQRERAVLTKIKFPLIVVILSGFGKVCSDTLIRFCFVILAFVLYGVVPKWTIIFFPFIMLPVILFSFGTGVIVSLANVVVRDTRNVVEMFLRYGMFLCSVIFAMPTTGLVGAINRFNIFNQFIVGTRELLVFGQINDVPGFLISSLGSVIVFMFSVKALYSLEYKIVGHL